ncbi:hypothetical protein TrLO_g7728 [Triparma laevis f. longispina]|nr:hypothetical protein TrLO_g7728 [Triparma laevis f. longispina]
MSYQPLSSLPTAVADGTSKAQQQPNASSLSCIANLTNTILGSGMLGLPFAFSAAGSITGTILLLIAATFSSNGLMLLSISATHVGITPSTPSSFYSVAQAAYPPSTALIDFAVAFKCFGVATGYLITVGDCMVDAMKFITGKDDGGLLVIQRQFWIVLASLLVASISFFRTLDALKYTSMVSVVFVLAMTVVIVLYSMGIEGMEACDNYAPTDDDLDAVCVGDKDKFTSFESTMSNLAVFVFSFTCHQNIFSVCNEIKDRTQAKVNTVIFTSIGAALLLYLMVAWAGFNTFGSSLQSDILLNYPQNALVTTMRIFVAFLVIFSYPLQLDPSRRCIITLINKLRKGNGDEDFTPVKDEEGGAGSKDSETDASINSKDLGGGEKALENVMFYGITIVFLVASFSLAMIVTSLGTILNVVGATGSTMVSYILPGVVYIKLFEGETGWRKRGAMLQVGVGCIIIPVALYFIFHTD